jgi:predicted TIM-barrel fold metal-dependent hydrolase
LKYVAANAAPGKLVPNTFDVDGTIGYVTGTQLATDGASLRGNFHYAVKKGSDGKWRIAVESFSDQGSPAEALTGERLIAELDVAGIHRAVVLSVAYWFDSPLRSPRIEDEYAKVRAENDWVANQVARYPDRLVAFFSFNPLKEHALNEIERCSKDPRFKGIKLHFANSGVDVLKAQHVESLRRVFRAANEHRLAILVHLWVPGRYGQEQAEVFLQKIIPAAPDVPIQIAHLAAAGPGYHADAAMKVYAEAAARGDPRMKHVYFDVAGNVLRGTQSKTLELVATRLRQLGMKHVLFGSDRAGTFNVPPDQAWAAFRRLPLTTTSSGSSRTILHRTCGKHSGRSAPRARFLGRGFRKTLDSCAGFRRDPPDDQSPSFKNWKADVFRYSLERSEKRWFFADCRKRLRLQDQ